MRESCNWGVTATFLIKYVLFSSLLSFGRFTKVKIFLILLFVTFFNPKHFRLPSVLQKVAYLGSKK